MTGRLLLGVDIGTYSAKGVLTTPTGQIVAEAVIEHGLQVPRPGWAEHDPEELWWGQFVRICRALLSEPSVSSTDIDAVGVSAIGPCVVAVDESGRARGPGILYGIDTRATTEIRELDVLYGSDAIYFGTGSTLTTQAGGPKILWLRRHLPDVWSSAQYFHSAADYIVLRLTGEHVMDAYTASCYTPLFDPASQDWNERFADKITDLERLPSVRCANELAGEITSEASRATGLAARHSRDRRHGRCRGRGCERGRS